MIPKIKEVIAVQKEVNFDNGDGDTIIGYIDLIARWEDGVEYILDNKTSGKPYKYDAIQTSDQLSVYSVHEGIPNAGFIVPIKAIRKLRTCIKCLQLTDNARIGKCDVVLAGKRCNGEFNAETTPKARIQILLGKASVEHSEKVMDQFITVNQSIKDEVFKRNTETCGNYYGARCPYFAHCHQGSDEGLEKCQK